ncbi:hypothetical protein GE21DRAFT_9931 [Neurospora crassa]|uniref:Secreted protein n=1 Tax=Neurospora crassa (strain ATCC 24698 / 74-OR23-1A / CBS 708.71 / DSM 1257 / FGSC 987) TaxID=367110 RepID=Q7S0S4_NEUCR|nr:secreted protein [Neurospora crassa OR74A]EAA28927.1 secreted protein [Neurospora crassa OR74A]KHE85656.1 hypothetical protein GE21DRAFT_9931 [Neurospora crassa]|eukprot:XP_958163.1 secreted protein [Neurospora crassa OR74A]
MKPFFLISLLVTVFMSLMLATTAQPSLPLNNRRELAEHPPVKGNPPNTGYALDWCKYTAGMLFQWDLPTFIKHREANFSLGRLTWDWSSDGCTHVPDNPVGFPFKPACQRHDFGYRNYQVQFHFTPRARWKIDENFLKDMKFQCIGHNIFNACHFMAHVYHWGVRTFYKGHEQYRESEPSHKMMDTMVASESSDVFDGMDADEARDALNPYLSEEKTKEYYDRALARYNKCVEEAMAQGIDLQKYWAAF